MTTKKNEPRPALLKYSRDLELREQVAQTLTLGELRALVAEAADKGFSDFSRVKLRVFTFGPAIQYITIRAV